MCVSQAPPVYINPFQDTCCFNSICACLWDINVITQGFLREALDGGVEDLSPLFFLLGYKTRGHVDAYEVINELVKRHMLQTDTALRHFYQCDVCGHEEPQTTYRVVATMAPTKATSLQELINDSMEPELAPKNCPSCKSDRYMSRRAMDSVDDDLLIIYVPRRHHDAKVGFIKKHVNPQDWTLNFAGHKWFLRGVTVTTGNHFVAVTKQGR